MDTTLAMNSTAGALPLLARFRSPKLVARNAERKLLLATIARAPAVVFVEGEAGIGKTRLVGELDVADRHRRRVLTGNCHPQGLPFPLQPVVEALRLLADDLHDLVLPPVAGALRLLLPELAARLPDLPESLGDRQAEGHQMFRAVRELLTLMGPTVLVLEDLHWADEGTVELLQYLVGDLPPQLSLVLTYRREDLNEWSPLLGLAARVRSNVAHARIVLSPLDTADVAALTGAIVGVEAVDDCLAGYLHHRTEGVPFAVEEVLRVLHERNRLMLNEGRLSGATDLEGGDVPVAIRDAVIDRVGRLDANTRQLVRAAAVFGNPVGETLLGMITGLDEDARVKALSEALQSLVLQEDAWGKASFRHELTCQAIYQAIPPPQLRQIHSQVAGALEADRSGTAVRLAYHYREAGRISDWVEHAEMAADQALALYDEPSACRILQEVLAFPAVTPAVRAHLARKLGLAANLGLAQRQAVEILGEVIKDDSLPPLIRGELRLLVGMAKIGLGQTAAGSDELRRCIVELRPNKLLSSLAMVYLAYPTLSDDPLRVHVDWLDKAAETVDAIPQPQIRVNMYKSFARDRSAILVQIGDPAGWDAIKKVPLALGPERRHAASWYNTLARGAGDLGHGARAVEFLVQCQAVLTEINYPQIRPAVAGCELLLDWYGGRWDGLQERAQALVDDPDEGPVKTVLSHLVLALTVDACGVSGDSEHHLHTALQHAERVGSIAPYCTAAGALASYYLRSKHRQAAFDVAGGAVDVMRRKQMWVWADAAVPAAVEAMLGLGNLGEAKALVAEVEKGLVGTDAPAAQAALLLCRGMVAEAGGRHKQAAAAFNAAADGYAALPRPYETAIATERAARALAASARNRPEAGERAGAALDAFEKLGAKSDGARVRTFIRRRGVALPPRTRPGRPALGSELSGREEQILALANAGNSVPDIAEQLHLSKRTVENHLANARRKQQTTDSPPP